MEALVSSSVVSKMNLPSFRTNVSSSTSFPWTRLNPIFNIQHGNRQMSCSSRVASVSICSKSAVNKSLVLGGLSLHRPLQKRDPIGNTFVSVEDCTYPGSVTEDPSHAAEEKIGVILLNFGAPNTLRDVQPFLFNLFADPDIIRLPWLFQFLQRPLAQMISKLQAPKSMEGYAAIGGGSPLRRYTYDQAYEIWKALKEKEVPANVYVGMRYWHPFTEESVQLIKRDGITRLVVLPLYPQYSLSTTGSSIRVLQNIFGSDPDLARLPVAIIQSWYQRQGYIQCMANLIVKELHILPEPNEAMIFFSAHGVPVSYVENAGDPYRDQMEDCISLIMQELKARGVNNDHTLAYQSRVGPIQWLKPYTDEVIVELGQKGVKSLLAVPVSFACEHLKTLEKIDVEYKELALESGVVNWGRVPSLNYTPAFIADLADAVIEALPLAMVMSSITDTITEETAMVMSSTSNTITGETGSRPVRYLIIVLFGSILAFVLLFSPKMQAAFKRII